MQWPDHWPRKCILSNLVHNLVDVISQPHYSLQLQILQPTPGPETLRLKPNPGHPGQKMQAIHKTRNSSAKQTRLGVSDQRRNTHSLGPKLLWVRYGSFLKADIPLAFGAGSNFCRLRCYYTVLCVDHPLGPLECSGSRLHPQLRPRELGFCVPVEIRSFGKCHRHTVNILNAMKCSTYPCPYHPQ